MPEVQQRPKSLNASLVIIAAIILVSFGIAFYLGVKARKPADFSDEGSTVPSVSLGTTPTDVQAAAEHNIQTFLGDLKQQNYNHALVATTKDFPSPHTSDALKTVAQSDGFLHIIGGPLKFEPAHLGSHGQSLILRGTLHSSDKPYRLVCTFVKKDNVWLISNLQVPDKSLLTPSAQSAGATATH